MATETVTAFFIGLITFFWTSGLSVSYECRWVRWSVRSNAHASRAPW